MGTNNFKIIKLDQKYIKDISTIWTESLPNNLKSMIGGHLITIYLSKFLKDNSNIAIGLFDSDKLYGFVLFGNDGKIIKQIVKENFFLILVSFIKSFLLFDFFKIKNFINCFIFILLSKKKETYLRKNNTELIIICVSNVNQNKGLGSFLFENAITNYDIHFQQFEGIFVKTLKKDMNNISFYKKNKFNHLFELFGRVYLRYTN
tara:strand:- start:86 stop:697 length:612 start_codon:yes stop_codon:yes gene_type:complete